MHIEPFAARFKSPRRWETLRVFTAEGATLIDPYYIRNGMGMGVNNNRLLEEVIAKERKLRAARTQRSRGYEVGIDDIFDIRPVEAYLHDEPFVTLAPEKNREPSSGKLAGNIVLFMQRRGPYIVKPESIYDADQRRNGISTVQALRGCLERGELDVRGANRQLKIAADDIDHFYTARIDIKQPYLDIRNPNQ